MKFKLKVPTKNVLIWLPLIFYFFVLIVMSPAQGSGSAPVNFSNEFDGNEFKVYLSKKVLDSNSIKKFYTNRAFKPFWYGEFERTQELLKAIDQSAYHGLPKSKYEILINNVYANVYEFEFFAMKAFLSLISDLSSGILEPHEIDKSISVYPIKIDHKEVLTRLMATANSDLYIFDLIYSFAPRKLEYTKLLDELDRLKEVIVANGWGEPVPRGKFLGYNLNHPNVGKLRTRLFQMGYLTFDGGSELLDAELKSAIVSLKHQP